MSFPDIRVLGTGAFTPYGRGARTLFQGVLSGRDAFSDIERFPICGCPYTRGGEIKELNGPQPPQPEALILPAVREALAEAGIRAPGNCALVLSTNFGDANARLHAFGKGPGSEAGFHGVTCRCADRLAIGPLRITTSLSCSSGLSAMAAAADLLLGREAETVVACGYDLITPLAWSGLSILRTMTPDRVRPFSPDRTGTLFTEGAGAAVLSTVRAESAVRFRGAGLSNNAFHMTAPDKEGAGYARAVVSALRDAETGPSEIDHINLHGTATALNDPAEAAALKTVFGERISEIPATSLKSSLGHAMGASGILEAIVTILSIRENRIPPTLNTVKTATGCGINLVTGAERRAEIRCALTLSSGIGGNNAAAVFSGPETAERTE